MTATISDRASFLTAIKADPTDKTAYLVYADWCDDNGDHDTAAALRDGTWQSTQEGEQIVVVGRDGPDHDRHGNGIYTTKVYEAVRRQRDGRLTWRLSRSVRMHRTAGKTTTGPMFRRAEAYAAEHGIEMGGHITHGMICR